MDSISPLYLTAMAAVGASIAYIYYSTSQDSLPGPKGISGLIEVFSSLSKRKSHELFMKYAKKYEIFSVNILGLSSVLVCEKEAGRQILNSKQFVKGGNFEKLAEGILNNALFVLGTGEKHRRHRKLIQPGFGPTHLRSAVKITLMTCKKLTAIWNEKLISKGQITTNAHSVMATLALDVIGMVAFGKDLKFTDQLKEKDIVKWEAMERLTNGGFIMRAFVPKMFWELFGVGSMSKAYKAASLEIGDLLRGLAKERKESILARRNNGNLSGDHNKGENWGMDVLERLLLGGEDGKLDDEEIFGELLGFFLAGHETSANTLTFAILQVCYNPSVGEKLYEEIKNVDLDQEDNPTDTLMKLKYLDHVMKEVQRLHSIVGSVSREAVEDVVVMGRPFPKGTRFSVYIRAIHLNPKYYEKPEEFNPDRWETPQTVGAWMPFGDGSHNCIGQKLAEIEFKIILMELVRGFKFSLVPDAKVEFFTTITHGMKNGLMVNITRRKE